MAEAKYIGCSHEGWEHTWLFYEYRGHEYSVIKHNNGCMDKSLRQQHQEEQHRIDEEILHANDPIPAYTGAAEEGFNLFWDFVEGN